jgi:hypothetical protein
MGNSYKHFMMLVYIYIYISIVMETKEELVKSIREWISFDSDIAKLQSQLKEKRDQKRRNSEQLVNTMKKNSIDCFDINGGAILYKRNVVKKPLTGKTMLPLLEAYLTEKNASCDIKADDLTKFLLDNRVEKVTETVRRRVDK